MRLSLHKWGHEDIKVETDKYCYEEIHMKKGWCMAYHYHREKQETFIPISGDVVLNDSGTEFLLTDTYTIYPGTPHSLYALTDAVIGEVSTEHKDEDVVKLKESHYVK